MSYNYLRKILWDKKIQLVHTLRRQKYNKTLVIFEGFDCAGKTNISKNLTEHLPPKSTKLIALGTPTRDEESQIFGAQRFLNVMPASGELVVLDRSYYSRSNVEQVMGFVSRKEANLFLKNTSKLEDIVVNSDVKIIKYWVDVSPRIQKNRLKERMSNPLKQWKLSPIDMVAIEKREEYIKARNLTFQHTHRQSSPWYVINGNNKLKAKINTISHLINVLNHGHSNFKPFTDLDSLRIEEKY